MTNLPPTNKLTRAAVLEYARACVCGDRQEDYGTPERNFATIAALWNAYLAARGVGAGPEIQARDVAAMMALLKLARVASGKSKADNWVDLAGYAACGAEIEASDKK